MKYPIHFHPLSLILLLAGTEPIHEAHQVPLWKKLNKIGLVFCVLQLVLTILGYGKESRRAGVIDNYTNNIMQVSIINKQMFTIVLPYVYVLTKLYHHRHLHLFHSRLGQFDALIRAGEIKGLVETLQKMHEASWVWNLIAALSLVVGEVVNIAIGAAYIYKTTLSEPQFETFYFYQVTIVNFVGAALDISVKLNGLKMRLHLLLELEREIVKDIVRGELEKRRIIGLI